MTGYFHRISPWKVGSVFAIIQTRVMWGGCYWVTILHLLAIPLLSKYDNCIIRFPPRQESAQTKQSSWQSTLCFSGDWDGQESARNARDTGSVSGLERSPGGGHDNPLQYSCLEKPMHRGAWWATVHGISKSQTRLSNYQTCWHILWMIVLLSL